MCGKRTFTQCTLTPSLGVTASPYTALLQTLTKTCKKYCVTQLPIANLNVSLLDFVKVGCAGGNYIANIRVSGTLNYIPAYTNGCCVSTVLVDEVIPVPFYSATAPTCVTVSANPAHIAPANVPDCCMTTNWIATESFITITVAKTTSVSYSEEEVEVK